MNSNDSFENMRLMIEKLNNLLNSPVIKIFQEQQRITRELVEPLNVIKESQQQIRSIQDMILPSVPDFLQSQEMLNKSLQPILNLQQEYFSIFAQFDSINQMIRDSFGTVSEIIERAKEDFEEYNKIMLKYNFPPHHDMNYNKFEVIDKISESHGEEQAKEKVYSIIIENYTGEMINLYLKNWEEIDWLQSRLPILKESIINYMEKRYYSVVSCILPMFEGMIIERSNKSGFIKQEELKNIIKKIFDKKGGFSIDETVKIFYLDGVLGSFQHGQVISSPLSRHAILHGADINYGSQINALRCILLLDYLIFKLTTTGFD